MGKRHSDILVGEFGQICELVDIEFNPETYKWSKWRPDSVLICTPAETHADIINKLPPYIPVFCEKPLIVDLEQKIAPRGAPTLMACNWTWCKHIKKAKKLWLWYESNDKYRELDYIHFCLLPHLNVKIDFDSKLKGSTLTVIDQGLPTGKRIHTFEDIKYKSLQKLSKPCSMFVDQMRHWLNVLQGKEKSRLPFLEAEKYNRELLCKPKNID